jgi:hypothetical protein
MPKKISDMDKKTLGELGKSFPEKVEKPKELPVCVHCGKSNLKKVLPELTLEDGRILYECRDCKERQYS